MVNRKLENDYGGIQIVMCNNLVYFPLVEALECRVVKLFGQLGRLDVSLLKKNRSAQSFEKFSTALVVSM